MVENLLDYRANARMSAEEALNCQCMRNFDDPTALEFFRAEGCTEQKVTMFYKHVQKTGQERAVVGQPAQDLAAKGEKDTRKAATASTPQPLPMPVMKSVVNALQSNAEPLADATAKGSVGVPLTAANNINQALYAGEQPNVAMPVAGVGLHIPAANDVPPANVAYGNAPLAVAPGNAPLQAQPPAGPVPAAHNFEVPAYVAGIDNSSKRQRRCGREDYP